MTAMARITAVDRFIKGCREDGIYDDLNACCVMAGWDSLAGALTPLKGAAPTNSGFLDADLDRGIGLKGNGSSKYINSNRANNADPQNDNHNAVYCSTAATSLSGYLGSGAGVKGGNQIAPDFSLNIMNMRSRRSDGSGSTPAGYQAATGFIGHSRDSADSYDIRISGTALSASLASESPVSDNITVYKLGSFGLHTNATLAFYSIGSATDLALLDARVSTLMADLRAIEEAGFDRDAIAYIRAVEEADGAYLETSVKVAINNLVSGLKADGLWDAIGSSCLLCGPRTLAGALVPLKGDAPTPYGFVSGDHSRTDGLRDPGGTSYLDSGFNVSAEYLNDVHISAYSTLDPGGAYKSVMGAYESAIPSSVHMSSRTTGILANVNNNFSTSASDTDGIGFIGVSRSNAANANARAGGTTFTEPDASVGVSGLNVFVFARNNSGSASASDMRLAFYSAGTFLDLAKLDTHVTAYVTAIGAAL